MRDYFADLIPSPAIPGAFPANGETANPRHAGFFPVSPVIPAEENDAEGEPEASDTPEPSRDPELARYVANLAEAFYSHLFGVARRELCCSAPAGVYCAEGQRLRDAYYKASREANLAVGYGGLSAADRRRSEAQ